MQHPDLARDSSSIYRTTFRKTVHTEKHREKAKTNPRFSAYTKNFPK